ncbi:MAG TPA: protein kinase [Bryobacteraceae bacterium]|nr:protein kinase [Bryobacteraceae bacterium]
MVGNSIKQRYEIRAVLGQGGMGVVYHAYDTLMRRDVALKTLRDVPSNTFLDLFSRECSVLAGMVHPNVVEVFDMGEFEEDGVAKPYFVMPLLPGSTLHDLIYPDGIPLSATRCVDIISQACRGLQAAHERELLHRDIKPRNIFVMRDDAVKVIDFGVAHLIGGNSTGIRGTPQYMSPEQINFKQLDNRSDIFSLAVVCYEALTGSHPFLRREDRRDSDMDIVEAITTYIPPLASDLNPAVNRPVAQVVAKAMAKDVWNRFETASAFAEALQKALRNENPGANSVVIRTRLERARRCFEQNDLQFASEIVSQLEAEGHSGAEIVEFRRELDQAVQRARTDRLMTAANRCFADEEYTLALRKIQEVLEIDAANSTALALKKRIQNLLTEQKIGELLKLAAEHLERSAFTNARQAVQDALKLRPSDTRARQFLSEVDSRQKDVLRQRQDQERLYQAAQAAFFAGKIELAIENLDQLERLTSQSSDIRERAEDYKELYRRVRVERDALKTALAQAHNLLDHDLVAAQRICDRYLAKYSEQPDFVALSKEIAKRLEEAAEAFRKTIASRVESEDSLDLRLRILEDALKSYPKDDYFLREIQNVRSMARTVAAVAEKARALERQGDFLGAISEWDNLRAIHSRFPGLSDEVARARNLFQKQRSERKADLLNRIENAFANATQDTVGKLLEEAEREFPSDGEIAAVRLRREKQLERAAKVESLLDQARRATKERLFQDAVQALAEAGELSGEVASLKRSVFQASLNQAEAVAGDDWRTAKTILELTAKLDTELSVPARFWEDVLRRERDEDVVNALRVADAAQTADDLLQARVILQQGLEKHAKEPRLQAKLGLLEKAILEKRRKEERERDLQSLRALRDELRQTEVPTGVRTFITRGKTLAERYGRDREFTSIVVEIGKQVEAFESASGALARGDIEGTFRISNEVLARDPEHRLFLNLKAQAETREREKATEFLEQVAHRLAAEPDLLKRGKILEEALREYPNEQYFADELALVRNQERIIRTITDRAQALESEGFPSEALEQWTDLKTLYPFYPGVDSAIAHCGELIRKKRADARAKLLSAIDKAVEDRDYESALEWLREAQAEYPNDPELPRRGELISRRSQLRAQALNHLKQGEGNFISGQFQPGRESIRQALDAAENEPDIPASAAAILIRHAGQALTTDLAIAESMMADAKAADPAVVIPQELQSSLLSARRQSDLDQLRSLVQPLEETGNFAEALTRTQRFLEAYPGEPEVLLIQDRLLKAKEKAEKKVRREQQLSELRSFEESAKTISRTDALRDLLERTRVIAHRNTDPEVTRVAEQVSRVLSAIAQIQSLVDGGRLKEAEDLCVRSIAEFPQNAALENWRSEIELRRMEEVSAYLREVERRLASEPDYSKQEEVLKEAIRLYPSESYYTDELTLLHNKQVLLNAELARARDLESRELYEDALREWEGLRNLYPWYPGIDNDLERVRREWELRTTAIRNNWVGRIHKALAVADADTASSILQQASLELAGDPVLADLRTKIEDVRQGQIRRSELASQGADAFRDARLADGAELLTTAAGMFKDDVGFRDWVLELMLRKARSSLENDWQGAELLVKTIGQIDPNYPIPVDLPEAIRSRQREAEVVHVLDEVDRAESSGDLAAAKRSLELGKAKFPDEVRINQRLEIISNRIRQLEIEKLREQAHQQTLQFRSQLQSTNTKRQLAKLRSSYVSKGLAESRDREVRALAYSMIAEIDSKIQALEVPQAKQSGPRRFLLVPLLVVLLIGVVVAVWLLRKPKAKPVTETKVAVVTPPIPAIQISGNVEAGDVYLDGAKVGALNFGSSSLSEIAPGSHVLRISSREGDASIPFFEDSVAGPRVNGPITAKRVSVLAVAAKDQSGTLSTSALETQPVFVDRQPVGSTLKGSLALPVLQPGTHHLQIGRTSDAPGFDVVVRQKPSLYVLVSGAAPTGTLEVKINIPGADLFLNGKKYNAAAETTARLVLPARGYDIYAARDGYVNSDTTHVDLARDSRVGVNLRLTPKPALLQLQVRSPGARIKVDGVDLGDVSGGKATPHNISPGMHTFEISRQGFLPKRFGRSVEPGHTLTLTVADLDLSPAGPDAAAREAEDWNRVKASGNLADWYGFQQRYPTGPHAQAASEGIQRLEWSGVDKNSEAALNSYITKHPEGSHSNEARRLLAQLGVTERNRAEQSDWDSLDKNKKDDVRAFMTKYPNGSHTAAAQHILADFANQEGLAAQQAADDNAWRSADATDRASLERYLGQFPSGRHANQAQQALANINQRPPPQADAGNVLAVLQRYAAAWLAKDQETILALQPNLNRRTLKAELAPVRVWRMTLTPLSPPQIDGDHASVTCRRQVDQVFSDGTEKQPPASTVTFALKKQGAGWVIEAVR